MNTDPFTLESRCYKPKGQKQEHCSTGFKHFCSGSQNTAEVISVRGVALCWTLGDHHLQLQMFSAQVNVVFLFHGGRHSLLRLLGLCGRAQSPKQPVSSQTALFPSPSVGLSFHCSEN